MTNRNTFPVSLFGVAFIAALLLAAPPSHAAMQTFEKEYTYTASELDSKSSCRAIALEQVKRILLQELGVYVESVFNDKASTDGRTKDEVRREITTLSAGVASTEVVEEKWNGTTYWLKARIKADPDDVAKKIEALRQDKQKSTELEEARKKAAELTQELARMRVELADTKGATNKVKQIKKYNDTADSLTLELWASSSREGMVFVKQREGGFFMDKTEVTQEAYQRITGNNPSKFSGCPTCPVEQVTWYEADVYCIKVGKRLPTGPEWEFAAASGGQKEIYAGTSDDSRLGEYAWYGKNSGFLFFKKTHSVGKKKPNGLGLYDMSGNVFEWVDGWYNDAKKERALRGGSYGDSADYLRTDGESYHFPPNYRDSAFGFRCIQQ